mgnify:CR=1 FL=1
MEERKRARKKRGEREGTYPGGGLALLLHMRKRREEERREERREEGREHTLSSIQKRVGFQLRCEKQGKRTEL